MKNNISYAEYVNKIKKKIVDKVDANGGKLRFLRELNGYIDTIEVRKENDLYVVDAVMEHMVMKNQMVQLWEIPSMTGVISKSMRATALP